ALIMVVSTEKDKDKAAMQMAQRQPAAQDLRPVPQSGQRQATPPFPEPRSTPTRTPVNLPEPTSDLPKRPELLEAIAVRRGSKERSPTTSSEQPKDIGTRDSLIDPNPAKPDKDPFAGLPALPEEADEPTGDVKALIAKLKDKDEAVRLKAAKEL